MTEQDKQALIKHFCERDCGEAAKGCTIMPCHEIELIQEFPTTEPDADTISRAKAIEAVGWYSCHSGDKLLFADNALRQLPTIQPKRGRWVKLDMHRGMADHKCSVCEQECYVPTCMGEPMYAFCPNCGADMRGEQDD